LSDDYLNYNLRKNRSKENMDRFGEAPIEYPSVLPVSDLTAATKIEKGTDLNLEKSKAEKELEEFAPLNATTDYRIDESKDKSGVYLIQTWAKKVRCKKISCNHVWYYKGKRDHTLCPSCYTYVDVQTQMVK
jgi:hypothetical protein